MPSEDANRRGQLEAVCFRQTKKKKPFIAGYMYIEIVNNIEHAHKETTVFVGLKEQLFFSFF